MVGIYCRISGNKEDDKDTSIDTQKEQGIAFANSLNQPYKVYYDIGVSGAIAYEKRNDFSKFLKDIKDGKIQHIYAIHQSRIERSLDTWRLFVGTVLNSGAKWYPNGQFFSLDNSHNRLMANMMSLINEYHSTNTSDAVKIAFEKNALKGKGHGIKAYGIDYDEEGYMIQNEKEMEVVKKMFKWSLEGKGVYTIANMLNDKDIPTRFSSIGTTKSTKDSYTGNITKHNNKKWWGSTVSGILKKKLYMGIHTWNGEEISLPHLAVITPDEFEAVQKNFKKNKREKSGKPTKHKYLLNGLLFCNECGHKYYGKRREASRENAYKCSGKNPPLHVCKHSRGFSIPKIETFIIKHLFLSRGLQEHLNSIEIDNDELEVMELEQSQLEKKIITTKKLVTTGFNLLYKSNDDDLSEDKRIKDKYKSDKLKLSNYEKALDDLKIKISEYRNNQRVTTVNNVIDGFDINIGFKGVKKAVHALITRVNVRYMKRDKGGTFEFKIMYKGYKEATFFYVNQQLLNFTYNKNEEYHDKDEDGFEMVTTHQLSKRFARYRMKGMMKHELDVFIDGDNLIKF